MFTILRDELYLTFIFNKYAITRIKMSLYCLLTLKQMELQPVYNLPTVSCQELLLTETVLGNFAAGNFATGKFAARKFRRAETWPEEISH